MLGDDFPRCSTEVGYRVGQRFWGRDIATDALRAATRYAFDTLGLARVFAAPSPSSHGSVRVLEKAGYLRDGLMRHSAIIAHDGTAEAAVSRGSPFLRMPMQPSGIGAHRDCPPPACRPLPRFPPDQCSSSRTPRETHVDRSGSTPPSRSSACSPPAVAAATPRPRRPLPRRPHRPLCRPPSRSLPATRNLPPQASSWL